MQSEQQFKPYIAQTISLLVIMAMAVSPLGMIASAEEGETTPEASVTEDGGAEANSGTASADTQTETGNTDTEEASEQTVEQEQTNEGETEDNTASQDEISEAEGEGESSEGDTGGGADNAEGQGGEAGSTEESLDEAIELTDEASTTTATTTEDGDTEELSLTFATTTATSTDGEDHATSTEEVLETATSTDPDELVDELAATTTATSTPTDEDTTTIQTGNAFAMANLLNLLNLTSINSNGQIVFSNLFQNPNGSIDLRQNGSNGASGTTTCALFFCGDDEVSINLLNDAFIENIVFINASSGNNTIDGAENAVISTGDAYAGLNVVNIANTSFVNSDYLLVTLNAFEGLDGDIVFPNLKDFLASVKGSAATTTVNTNNTAAVDNDLSIDAESGENETEDTGTSTTLTGDSEAKSSVVNQINSTLAGGHSVSILLRIHGAWNGEIFGTPAGYVWENVGGGLQLMPVVEDATSTATSIGSGDSIAVNGTSTAAIANTLGVGANSGGNAIFNADNALISTGNAYAGLNLVNIANATVMGRNWILAIINIFGDFNGNIAFGRPDLWIGEQIHTPPQLNEGDELTYAFTILNNGDADANDVVMRDAYDAEHIEILSSSHDYTIEDGEIVWHIGSIAAGEGVEVTYEGQVQNAPPGTDITNVVTVSGHEPDNDTADNTDTATVTTHVSGGTVAFTPPPPVLQEEDVLEDEEVEEEEEKNKKTENISELLANIAIERETATTTLLYAEERTVEQSLVIRNTGDRDIPDVVIVDLMRDPSGRIINEEVWELGDVLAHEEIRISYSVSFGPEAPAGIYVLTTRIESGGVDGVYANGSITLLPLATLALPEADDVPVVTRAARSTIETIDPQVQQPRRIERDTATTTAAITGSVFPSSAGGSGNLASAAGSGFSWPEAPALAVLLAIIMLGSGWFASTQGSRLTEILQS